MVNWLGSTRNEVIRSPPRPSYILQIAKCSIFFSSIYLPCHINYNRCLIWRINSYSTEFFFFLKTVPNNLATYFTSNHFFWILKSLVCRHLWQPARNIFFIDTSFSSTIKSASYQLFFILEICYMYQSKFLYLYCFYLFLTIWVAKQTCNVTLKLLTSVTVFIKY